MILQRFANWLKRLVILVIMRILAFNNAIYAMNVPKCAIEPILAQLQFAQEQRA